MTTLFVTNLPWGATEEDVRSFFSVFGPVHNVAIPLDRASGRPRGFAFVGIDAVSADQAISQAGGRRLLGRTLRVRRAAVKGRG